MTPAQALYLAASVAQAEANRLFDLPPWERDDANYELTTYYLQLVNQLDQAAFDRGLDERAKLEAIAWLRINPDAIAAYRTTQP